ncbi:MAG: class I SAM-dependent methyltransferase, partial [Acidimicrobiia bacterium]
APAKALSDLIREAADRIYVSIELDPDADGRDSDVRADVTRIPLRTGSAGFILCSHVLEHVPDDRSAMLELARVLKRGGSLMIQVPRRRGSPTDENLAYTAAEREIRYGQADHVRMYGDDFEDRLMSCGLEVASTSYSALLPRPMLEAIGVVSDHEIWVANASGDPASLLDPNAMLGLLSHEMISSTPTGQIEELEQRLEAALADVETWRTHYEWLRNKWPIRVASSMKRMVTGASRRDG